MAAQLQLEGTPIIRGRMARQRCSGDPVVAGARASVGPAILIAAVAIAPFAVVSADAAECGDLATLALPQTKIDAAQSIPAGSCTPPYTKPLADLPAFAACTASSRLCRVRSSGSRSGFPRQTGTGSWRCSATAATAPT